MIKNNVFRKVKIKRFISFLNKIKQPKK
jgi:hypothetical protein